jgi:hypothetical protein
MGLGRARHVGVAALALVAAVATADEKAAAPGSMKELVERSEGLTDELCRCTSETCAGEADRKLQELGRQTLPLLDRAKPTPGEVQELRELSRRWRSCMQRLKPAHAKDQARRAKSVEAIVMVHTLASGAVAYYQALAASGAKPHFPSAPRRVAAPPLGACCAGDRGRCAPDPGLWTAPVWRALKFEMSDPHYYSYDYVSSGTGANATFTAGAHGDLDCNGTYSTFEIRGSVKPDGTPTLGDLVRKDELE